MFCTVCIYLRSISVQCNKLRVSPVGACVSDVSCHTASRTFCPLKVSHYKCIYNVILMVIYVFLQLVHASLICLAALALDNTVCASIIMTGVSDNYGIVYDIVYLDTRGEDVSVARSAAVGIQCTFECVP